MRCIDGSCDLRNGIMENVRLTIPFPRCLLNFSSIFYINLPFCIPSLACIHFFVNLESEPRSIKERLLRVDWLGAFVLTGSLISLLYGVSSGGVLYAWNSTAVITTIVIGLFGIGLFAFYEDKFAKEPMIPLRIFGSRTAGAAYLSSFVLGFVLWAMQYYLILYVSHSNSSTVHYLLKRFRDIWIRSSQFPIGKEIQP